MHIRIAAMQSLTTCQLTPLNNTTACQPEPTSNAKPHLLLLEHSATPKQQLPISQFPTTLQTSA